MSKIKTRLDDMTIDEYVELCSSIASHRPLEPTKPRYPMEVRTDPPKELTPSTN